MVSTNPVGTFVGPPRRRRRRARRIVGTGTGRPGTAPDDAVPRAPANGRSSTARRHVVGGRGPAGPRAADSGPVAGTSTVSHRYAGAMPTRTSAEAPAGVDGYGWLLFTQLRDNRPVHSGPST